MDCRKPGLLVNHKLLELAQTHVHRVSDAICAAIGSPIHIHISPLFGFPSHLGHHRALNSLCYIMGYHLLIYFIHGIAYAKVFV